MLGLLPACWRTAPLVHTPGFKFEQAVAGHNMARAEPCPHVVDTFISV